MFKSRSKENHDKIKRYLGRGKDKSEEEEENEEEKDEDEEIVPDVVESNKSELVCILEKERKFKVQNKLVKNFYIFFLEFFKARSKGAFEISRHDNKRFRHTAVRLY